MTHTTPRRGLGRCVVAAVSAVVATAMLLTGCSAAGRSPTGNNAAGRNFGADQSFDLPPKGNFHTLSGVTGSIPTNLGYLNDMIMLPGGIYNWEKQQYYYSSNKTKYAGLCVVVSQSRVGYETRHECVFQVEV